MGMAMMPMCPSVPRTRSALATTSGPPELSRRSHRPPYRTPDTAQRESTRGTPPSQACAHMAVRKRMEKPSTQIKEMRQSWKDGAMIVSPIPKVYAHCASDVIFLPPKQHAVVNVAFHHLHKSAEW